MADQQISENITITPDTTATNAITITDSAAAKVNALIQEEGNPNLKLRAFVTGGGCSGFQYGFSFDEKKNEDDFEFQKDGMILLVDALSYGYLKGAKIDYQDDVNGQQFVITENKNAKTTCGCGSSFSAD